MLIGVHCLSLQPMKLVLFDLDGTLMKTYYGDDNSFLLAIGELIPIDPELKYWHDCKNLTDSAVFDHIYNKVVSRSPTPSEIVSMQGRFLTRMQQKTQTHPDFFDEVAGAVSLVEELVAKEDVLVGVATGGWRELADFKLSHAKFPMNDISVIGSDDHFSKTEFVRALMDRIKKEEGITEFESIHYLGDSTYDLNCSAELGIEFIGVDYKQNGNLKEAGAAVVFENFLDREPVFRALGI